MPAALAQGVRAGGVMVPRDRGAATVMALSVVAVVLALTTGALVVGSVVVASHRARLAADLASLAGASAAQEDSSPSSACAVAGQVARANGAVTQACSMNGADIEITVAVTASLWPAPATARARAGPERSTSPG
jgi:secretion/DNA translocation related TadE-like protein